MAECNCLMYSSLEEEEFDEREELEEREEERETEGAGVGERIILSNCSGDRVREEESRYSCIAGDSGE